MLRPEADLSRFDRVLMRSELMLVGAFDCAADEAWFGREHALAHHHLVLPLLPMQIERHAGPRFTASQASWTWHQPGEPYRRRAGSPQGDRCRYWMLSPALVADLLPPRRQPSALRGPLWLPPALHWPLAQRLLGRPHDDVLENEVFLLDALPAVLAHGFGPAQPANSPRPSLAAARQRLVQRTRQFLIGAIAAVIFCAGGFAPLRLIRPVRARCAARGAR
jgi:hypothetical protein